MRSASLIGLAQGRVEERESGRPAGAPVYGPEVSFLVASVAKHFRAAVTC